MIPFVRQLFSMVQIPVATFLLVGLLCLFNNALMKTKLGQQFRAVGQNRTVANVSGINLEDYCPICSRCGGMDELYSLHNYVKNSAYEIIKGKGSTYYAIAQATKRIVEAIVRDENAILPVSTYLDGHYGLNDICMSIPAVVGREGVKHVLDFPLSESETEALMQSAKILPRQMQPA